MLAKLCDLIQQRDEFGLYSLEIMGTAVDGVYGNQSAVERFAEEGDTAAVEYLIQKFVVNIDRAVSGYAYGGHVQAVNELLAKGASCNDAVYGYATGKHQQAVNELLRRDANIDWAVYGYARIKHTKEVNVKGKINSIASGKENSIVKN